MVKLLVTRKRFQEVAPVLHVGRFFWRMRDIVAVDALPVGGLADFIGDVDIRGFLLLVLNQSAALISFHLVVKGWGKVGGR